MGSFIEHRLMDAYLDSAARGQSAEARTALGALTYAGEVERQQAHDQFIPDLVSFYKSATPSQRKGIQQARGLMRSAHENFFKSNFDAAAELYSRAQAAFRRAGDLCEATHLGYLIGNCYLQQTKVEAGLSVLQ